MDTLGHSVLFLTIPFESTITQNLKIHKTKKKTLKTKPEHKECSGSG